MFIKLDITIFVQSPIMKKCLFLVLFCCQLLTGQQLQFDNLKTNIPLPSQECYNILQDSKGYIWFATEQGFCRYDGNSILIYDLKNGLPEGAVYAAVEDEKGRLWLLTSKNRILIIEKGVLKEAAFSKTFHKQAGKEIGYSLVLIADELYINTDGGTFVANITTNLLKRMLKTVVSKEMTLMKKSDKLIPLNSAIEVRKLIDDRKSVFKIKIIDEDSTSTEISIPRNNLFFTRVVVSGQNNDLFAFMNLLVDVKGKKPIHEVPKRALSFWKDTKGGVWIGMIQDGLYYYKDGDLSKQPIIQLKGYSVTGVMEDAEGNIWCTTLEKGVFRCLNKNVINYFNVPGLAKKTDLIRSVDGITYFSSQANELIGISQNEIQNFPINTFSREAMTDLFKIDNGWYIGGRGFVIKTNPNFGNARDVSVHITDIYPIVQFVEANKRLYGLSYSSMLELEADKILFIIKFKGRTRCFAHYKNNSFLYSADNELHLVDIKTKKIQVLGLLSGNITKILKTPAGQVWITTKGGGLYSMADGKCISMNSTFHLKPRILYDVIAVGNDLWLGSNEGLVKVALKSNESELFTTANGLPTNEIYKLSFDGKQLFLSTLEGVCSLMIGSGLKNNFSPGIYLSSLSINGIPQRKATNWKLKHDQNSFTIVFDALTFKSETQLLYRLVGRDTDSRINKGNKITLENLLPGNYKLIVYALNSDGVKSKKPVVLSFDIAQPFWKEMWFVVLCIVVSAFAIYSVVRKIIRNIQTKEKEKTRINKLVADSQLSALQAQMNPHFIFNAINSIQNYILKNREKEAYDYLAKFSKLIRMVLHNSQQKLLPLYEELETIKLYVELEQLRFSSSFDFDITINEEVDSFQTLVPTMIIQPYLENAIWHGLMNLEGQRRGKIELMIKEHNNLLQIIIADNGIGRKLAAAYKQENTHQPVAMKLTEQRITIVNENYGNGEISVTVEDLYDASAKPQGTKVIITLPINTE